MADCRHKRDTEARSRPRAAAIAGPLALLATASLVAAGVVNAEPETRDLIMAGNAAAAISQERGETTSRSAVRVPNQKVKDAGRLRKLTEVEIVTAPAATQKAVETAETKLWTTEGLNLWTLPGDQAKKDGVLKSGKQVLVTGRELFGRDEIVVDGESRWVTSGYLVEEEPSDEPAVATASATCSNGTSVASGVSPNIAKVHQAVCANFPEITTYGTFRGDGEHAQGIAVDIMVSGDRGWQVAEFVRANYATLGVNYVIYSQRIWSLDRSGEGWRGMSDRGSTTANHYDHVHVTTY